MIRLDDTQLNEPTNQNASVIKEWFLGSKVFNINMFAFSWPLSPIKNIIRKSGSCLENGLLCECVSIVYDFWI